MVIPEAADSKTNNYFSSKNIKEMRPVPIYYETFMYRSLKRRIWEVSRTGHDIIGYWRILPGNYDFLN